MAAKFAENLELGPSEIEDLGLSRSRSTATEHILTGTLESAGDISIAANTTPSITTDTQTLNTKDPKKTSMESLEVMGDSSDSDGDIVYPTGIKFAGFIMALTLGLIFTGLDASILSTAIPTITRAFKTTADIGWYVAAFQLSMISFQFMFGKLYQMFSIKIIFMISCAIFEVGSLLCATAATSKQFIVGRAICGMGSSGLMQGVFTMGMASVPLRQRSLYGGFGGAIEAIAQVCGPVLGGVITQSIGWRWCFYINLPLGTVTILLVGLFYQNPQVNPNVSLPWREKIQRLDILGTVIFIPSITTLLLALQYGGINYPWNDYRIIIMFIAFVASISAFIYLQYRKQERATIPPRIILQRSVLAGFLFSACNSAAMNVIAYYMPIYFQTVKQTSVVQSGVLIIPTIIGLFISVILGGAGTTIFGYYRPFMFLTGILVPIAAGLMTTLKVDAKLASLIVFQGFLGFGVGIGFQGPQVAVQTILSQADAPIGIAIVQFAQGFGPAVFVPIAQVIFTNRVKANLVEYAPNVNATSLDDVGLLNLKDHFSGLDLAGLLMTYDKAITQTLYLAVGLSCLTIVASFGVEWKSVKQKRS